MANSIEAIDQNVETMLTDFPAFAICGWSGSGKTSLIESVVPHLCKKGLKVAVLKHTDHEIQVDHPGKDSDRLFRSGADVFLKGSQEGLLRSREVDHLSLAAILSSLPLKYDLVLVEGEVKFPGRYTVPISTTTTDLLSYAGGPTSNALPEILRLYRRFEDGSQEMTEFDFNDILWGDGLEEKNREVPNLQAGDILVVPGTQRVYFMDWAQLSLAIISTVVSVATLIIVISR